MNDSKIVAIFSDTITESAIAEIESNHKGLIHDFTNDQEFKDARKVRTEMNKILSNIDRVGIDSAQYITDMRNDLKLKVERAYSGTVKPFLVEDQKRKDEIKRIQKEKDDRIYIQKQSLEMMRGASVRALHLPLDDIDGILQDVMNVDIESFDSDIKSDAKAAKEIALAQLSDAYKFATQKDEMRKQSELQMAAMADQADEIARLKSMLQEKEPVIHKGYLLDNEALDLAIFEWSDEYDINERAVKELETILKNYL